MIWRTEVRPAFQHLAVIGTAWSILADAQAAALIADLPVSIARRPFPDIPDQIEKPESIRRIMGNRSGTRRPGPIRMLVRKPFTPKVRQHLPIGQERIAPGIVRRLKPAARRKLRLNL